MSLFEPRQQYKPFEYPSVIPFQHAIEHSYWLVSELNFISDLQDYKVNLCEAERTVIRRAMLAISQVEVSVKHFWGKICEYLPKPEIAQVGYVFASSEVRHADAYSHLLEILGLNDEFERVMEIPAIRGRVDYLAKALARPRTSHREYLFTLALFSLFIENCSLFSQFLIIKSFYKQRNVLKHIDNIVDYTRAEENIHGLFGAHLVGLIRAEHPDWFDAEFLREIERACRSAFAAEAGILDWIFEQGDLAFLAKETAKEFLKDRFNQSLRLIALPPIFAVDRVRLAEVAWFDEETMAEISPDFFNKVPTAYSKKTQPVTASDLF